MFAELMNIVEVADRRQRRCGSWWATSSSRIANSCSLLPAAKKNHHAFVSGYLEHVLNVTRTCCHLADKYAELYNDLDPPLNKDVIIAGAVLHDIGKLRELAVGPAGAEYTAAGCLIGHVLQGRDIVREAAAGREIDPEMLLRLEHVIVSHQRLPEWGAPKPPMTPEALIVHYADDLDAKLQHDGLRAQGRRQRRVHHVEAKCLYQQSIAATSSRGNCHGSRITESLRSPNYFSASELCLLRFA